jgi:hypothetical protein
MNTKLCLPPHISQTKTNQPINQPTNQSTKELTEGFASRSPSAYLAIPALTASLGSVRNTLTCNCDCAYVNEFPAAVEDLDLGKLRAIVQGTIGFYEEA